MGDLSEHFSEWEFACHHCSALPRGRVPRRLVDVLERIRAKTGTPLVVVSGYRCPEHNRRVGGARRSRHLVGDAADLKPGACTETQARDAGATGVGLSRDNWAVHVDVRPWWARWRYR